MAKKQDVSSRKTKSKPAQAYKPSKVANAQAAGMSTSAYLLAVGQGYQVKGVTDFENVRDLVRVNGDLGRLGGLLKLWLTDDPRTARFGDDTIRALLARIEATQDKISTIDAIDQRTAQLQETFREVSTRPQEQVRNLSERGDSLAQQANSTDGTVLRGVRDQFDTLAWLFKRASCASSGAPPVCAIEASDAHEAHDNSTFGQRFMRNSSRLTCRGSLHHRNCFLLGEAEEIHGAIGRDHGLRARDERSLVAHRDTEVACRLDQARMARQDERPRFCDDDFRLGRLRLGAEQREALRGQRPLQRLVIEGTDGGSHGCFRV